MNYGNQNTNISKDPFSGIGGIGGNMGKSNELNMDNWDFTPNSGMGNSMNKAKGGNNSKKNPLDDL
eukprot:CAMPEP_0170522062 /NCGR_PEP_ID=MMETSP0209-20121228/7524_1 /TAXON_ID=665100 ORGANISM="Litonotus pictus, Strain P1" /NCGR_SAMPLE_ID=MMETSP0209 /ASSEMBLY_ACC=CAM_ASM_000301 /LENGTH=65 /DNA_ID=CAMNT_0010809375 /DNA_START=16 /DNA_END=210 /DNA_ORIENTATION=+